MGTRPHFTQAPRKHRSRTLLFAIGVCITLASPAFSAIPVQAMEGMEQANFQEILDQAKKKVFPALVFVKPIIEDFESGKKTQHQVFGSGVIISPNGLVVTNNHVVEKAVKVHCVLSDKTQVPAKILGRDPDTDLALLQLQVAPGQLPLPYGEFANSDTLDSGDFVMALGSPFGFTRSISLGIASNTQRYLGFESGHQYNNWIQTDAAINPGNSGGPLVNIEGKIVGINTLGITGGDNIGFSIPSNIVKDIAKRLETNKTVRRAWIGIKIQPLRDFFTDTFTEGDRGVLIANVEDDSPASTAELQEGDILLSVAGEKTNGMFVEDLPRISRHMAYLPQGKSIKVQLLRNGKEITVNLTPSEKGKVEGNDFDCRRWNLTVKEINKHKDTMLYFFKKKGIFIQGVRYDGNAGEAGLQRGDILLKIDGKPVVTLKDIETIYKEILADEKREKKVLFEVQRNQLKHWSVLDYTKDFDKEK